MQPGWLPDWVPAGPLLAGAWLLAALGYGRAIRALLFTGMPRTDPRRTGLSLGLGVAFLLSVDSLLATVGAFGPGALRLVGAWAVVATGIAAAAFDRGSSRQAGASLIAGPRGGALADAGGLLAPWSPWSLAWPAAAAVAVLAFVASLPPGIAWATEFGGYDALSYHLQLPKEWLEAGRAAPLRDSAYSLFPSLVETATMHAWTLASSEPVHALATAPQWMHAGMAVAAALVTGALAASLLAPAEPERARRWTIAFGTCALLGIPWVVVTGSLAYNDMAAVLLLATAMMAWTCAPATGGARAGVAVGLALGAAVGSKPTAAGMAVLPFLAWCVVDRSGPGMRAHVRGAAAAAAVGFAVLLPWLVRNALALGAPVFPFAGRADGWWTAEQAGRFAAGHSAPPGTGLGDRLAALWDQGFREGFGPTPGPDPWLPQWGLAFAAGSLALAMLLLRRTRGTAGLAAMLAVQAAFWMAATHLKPRFLLPCAVPIAVAMAIAFAPSREPRSPAARRALAGCLLLALLAWSLQPAAVLRMDPRMRDPQGAVANLVDLGGAIRDLGPGTRAEATAALAEGSAMPLPWIANWILPADAVLGCEGIADVFWCRRTPVWGTVWDGGPLARALRAHPDDAAAAVDAMRREGLTHLAIGEAMLARWKAAGWLDPALQPDRVRAVAASLRPIAALASGGTVYELPLAGSAGDHGPGQP